MVRAAVALAILGTLLLSQPGHALQLEVESSPSLTPEAAKEVALAELVANSGTKAEALASQAAVAQDATHTANEASYEGSVRSFVMLPMVLGCGVLAFALGGVIGPLVPAKILPYAVCAIYICFSVAIDISIAMQKKYSNSHGDGGGYAFNPVCAVLMTEAVKFCISLAIYSISIKTEGKPLIPAELSFTDAKWLALPALIFTANNILVFQAIGKNDMSAFGVFRDTMILWTAAMWRCVFKVELGKMRLAGIFIVFLGLVVNKVASSKSSGAFSWMFLWVLLMTLCNAAGSVANEYALKQNRALDINVQNMVLYTMCVLCSVLFLAITDPPRMVGSFFSGFDSHTWLTIGLQSLTGLLVSRLLKHTDSVMKTIATCLRGPVVVMVSPLFTHIGSSMASSLSALIVASGCFTYLTQGPLVVAQKK